MSLELLVLIAFLFLPPLISAALPWVRKQLQELEWQAAAERDRERLDALPAAAVSRPPRRALTPPPIAAPLPSLVSEPARPQPRERLVLPGLRSRSELRRTIVLMTVLGPCRAIDPY